MFRTKKQKEELANDLVALSKKNTRTADILSRLVRNKLGMLGLIIIAILLIILGLTIVVNSLRAYFASRKNSEKAA